MCAGSRQMQTEGPRAIECGRGEEAARGNRLPAAREIDELAFRDQAASFPGAALPSDDRGTVSGTERGRIGLIDIQMDLRRVLRARPNQDTVESDRPRSGARPNVEEIAIGKAPCASVALGEVEMAPGDDDPLLEL